MLRRGLREQVAIATGDFAKLFGKLEMPVLPQATVRLLGMMGKPDVDIAEIARVLASDPSLSARVLRVVNSGHVGLSQEVGDIRLAVGLLGANRVQSLVLGLSAQGALRTSGPGFREESFWQASLQRAVFADTLAKEIAPGGVGEAFTGALLQDMAHPILMGQWGEHYLPVLEKAVVSERELVEVEDEELSWTHAQAGAWMARNWGFPDVLACCVGLHHSTIEEIRSLGLDNSPVSATAASSRLPLARSVCCDDLLLSEEKYDEICETTDEACGALAELLGIRKPQPLIAAPSPAEIDQPLG